jgi:hypothetical protein
MFSGMILALVGPGHRLRENSSIHRICAPCARILENRAHQETPINIGFVPGVPGFAQTGNLLENTRTAKRDWDSGRRCGFFL